MTNPRPSMRDVAQKAGVSLKTVSRVVNNEPFVNSETAEKVLSAIQELGFRRNDLARQLRQGQTTATIGLIIEDIANPFYSQVARGVEAVARAQNCLVITASSEEEPMREKELVQALLARRVDGLILVPSARDHTYLHQEIQRGTPIVFIDRPPNGFQADTILLENRAGTKRGVQHLINKGHTRIAFIGGYPNVFTGAERILGYEEALKKAKLKLDPSLYKHDCHDVEHAKAATLELLHMPNPPTAIFAASNRQSLGVVHALSSSQQQLEVVGFDDLELLELLPVPVTVLRHDPVELGKRATELLFMRLEGATSAIQNIVLPVTLYQPNPR